MKKVILFVCVFLVVVLLTGCSADNNTLNNVKSGDGNNNPQNLVTSITLVDSTLKDSVDVGSLVDEESLSIYKEILDLLSELKLLSVDDSYDIDFVYQIKSDARYQSVSTVEYSIGADIVVITTNQEPNQYSVSVDSKLGSAIEKLHHRFDE